MSFTILERKKLNKNYLCFFSLECFISPSQTSSPPTDHNNFITFNTQLKGHFFPKAVPSDPSPNASLYPLCLTSFIAHSPCRIAYLCMCLLTGLFLVMVEEVVGITVPILQMRNQRLRKKKQLPLRSHTSSGSTRVPVQTVSQAQALQDYQDAALRNTYTGQGLVIFTAPKHRVCTVYLAHSNMLFEFGLSL